MGLWWRLATRRLGIWRMGLSRLLRLGWIPVLRCLFQPRDLFGSDLYLRANVLHSRLFLRSRSSSLLSVRLPICRGLSADLLCEQLCRTVVLVLRLKLRLPNSVTGLLILECDSSIVFESSTSQQLRIIRDVCAFGYFDL